VRWRSQALVELGRFEEAAGLAGKAMEIARARDHPYTLANAISARGFLCSRQGDFSAAVPLLEEGLRFSRALGLRSFVMALGTLLAEAWAQTGRSTEAQALLDELPPVVGSVYVSGHVPRPLVLLAVGRLQEARGLAGEALAWHRERGERGAEAWVLWLLGEITARESPDEADTAADRFRQALALARELGMRPLAAHSYLGLGKLSRRAGELREAQEQVAAAATMYREMEMRFWLEQAEVNLRAL